MTDSYAAFARGPFLLVGIAAGLALGACTGSGEGARGGPDDSGTAAPGDSGIGVPGERVVAEPEDEATYVFDQGELRTYNLVIDPAELAQIDAEPAAESYVSGLLELEGKTYGPLGVRYKGSIGAFLRPCTASDGIVPGAARGPRTGKCSLKVDFDRIDPAGRFYGLKKLNFHSGNLDPSLMRDRLGYAMFREFGVAAPRAVHARLLVNGELRGVYVVVEQIDGRFTKRRFEEGGDGNVYKEVWPTSTAPDPYLAALQTNRDANPSVQTMIDLATALAAGEDPARWVDPAYMLRYIAVDRVIVHDDGPLHFYCGFNHNFYWYEGENVARLWLVPWDLDAAFALGNTGNLSIIHIAPAWNEPVTSCACGGSLTGGGGFGIPSSCDPLIGAFAALRDDYARTVDAFLQGPYAEPNVSQKLATWSAQIDAAMQEASGLDGAPTYERWQEALAMLRTIGETTRLHRGYPYGEPAAGDGGAR